jgi:acetyl-CoA carboxylase carboxyltransferase component
LPDPLADAATAVPEDPKAGYDMMSLINAIADEDSVLQIKELYARELITAFARLDGKSVGIVASQPSHLGGVLFVDSADKAARFIWLCDAFNIPLVFLADVPGFMIGTEVERQGIIRSGAKMLTAIAEATVPRISVIVRKAYGAGLYAFSGPGLRPEATLALPTAEIAVMGPEAAINAVYFNKIQELDEADRAAFVDEKRTEYSEDVDLLRLSSELVLDAVVQPEDLRAELIARLQIAGRKTRTFSERRHGVPPV